MPLHLDYRPVDFDEIIGNKGTIDSLKSIFARKDIPHAFLFQGLSGCGKTTFARIIKEKLECADEDFMEINAANNRGIDTARDIMNTCRYMPQKGKTRVIMIDEVGATVKTFQEALLKPLEDTPEHVYFILCTTDPQKLKKTVRNRCTTFEVSKLTEKELYQLLNWVLKEEDRVIDKNIQEQIVERADGCPRQALVILDQIIDLDEDKQSEAIAEIQSEEQKIIDLCRALIKGEKWKNISKILKTLESEPENARWAILNYMDTALLSDKTDVANIMAEFLEPFYNSGKAGLHIACFLAKK